MNRLPQTRTCASVLRFWWLDINETRAQELTKVTSDPTKRIYLDENDLRMIFNWGRRMPNNGRLGDVTYGSLQKKLIQVFNPIENADRSKTWQFQAQDGSFLLSMKVSENQDVVTFFDSKKGNFPQVTVYAKF